MNEEIKKKLEVIEMITEKEMMRCIENIKEQLILSKGEGDMTFQEFRKWVRNSISEWYDYERGEE